MIKHNKSLAVNFNREAFVMVALRQIMLGRWFLLLYHCIQMYSELAMMLGTEIYNLHANIHFV